MSGRPNLEDSGEDSDIDEMPDLSSRTLGVQPYLFEPVPKEAPESPVESGRDTAESDTSSDSEDVEDVTKWCVCNRCTNMPKRRECKCCQTTNVVDGKIEEAEIDCITEHQGFHDNCLSSYVLEASYYEYLEGNGPLEEGELIHEVYRYIAYRRFVRWIFHKLGKNNRMVLPSCVVSAIRTRFPSQEYCGFKYPNK